MGGSNKLFFTKRQRVAFSISVLLLVGLMIGILSFPHTGNCIEKFFRLNDEPTEGNSVFPLSDGYLVLTNHRGHQNFTKFDLNGNETFSKDFYDATGGWPRSAVQTRDGGYLIAGLIKTNPQRGYLIRLDQNLEFIWGKEFSQEGAVWVGSAKETFDGGYVVLARGQDFIEVIKLKSDSSLDWQKRILTRGWPEAVDVHETGDAVSSGYVLCGRVYDTSSDWNLYLSALEKDGKSILWQWMIRGPKIDGKSIENGFSSPGASNIVQIDANHLALAASAVSAENNWSTMLISLTAAGVVRQTSLIEGSGGNWISDPYGGPNFIRLSDGGLLLGGYAPVIGDDKALPYLVKLQPDLKGISWQCVYTRERDEGGSGFLGLSESNGKEVVATGVGGKSRENAFLLGYDESAIAENPYFTVPSPGFILREGISAEITKQSGKLDDGIIKITEISTTKPDALVTSFAPGSVDFGTACVSQTVSRSVVFTNDQQFQIRIDQISFADPTPFSFLEGGTCFSISPPLTNFQTKILDPNESCSIIIGFTPDFSTPSAIQTFGSSLKVHYLFGEFSSQEESINLTGTGVSPPLPTVPTTVNFGAVCAGSSSDQTITVRNDGTCPVALVTIAPPSGAFSRPEGISGGTCSNGQILSAGGSCSIIVRFAPLEASPDSSFSSIAISYNVNPNSVLRDVSAAPPLPTVTINLTGTKDHQHITVSPTDVNLGIVAKKQTSGKNVTVTNRGCPLNTLTLNSIGSPSLPFRIEGGGTCTAGRSLKTGESCSIVIGFTPTQAGAFTSRFNISSDDSDNPTVTVNLKGGSGPDLTGEWISSEKQCKETPKGVRCTVKSVLDIRNIGTRIALPACVRFYLSRDGKFDQGVDTLLTQMETIPIDVGRSQKAKLGLNLPLGDTGNGEYIIAVIDCTNCVPEANEANNMIALPIR